MLSAGESVRAVADFLGHADPGFPLRVYAHLLPGSEDRARRIVGEVLSGPPAGSRTGPTVGPPAGPSSIPPTLCLSERALLGHRSAGPAERDNVGVVLALRDVADASIAKHERDVVVGVDLD